MQSRTSRRLEDSQASLVDCIGIGARDSALFDVAATTAGPGRETGRPPAVVAPALARSRVASYRVTINISIGNGQPARKRIRP